MGRPREDIAYFGGLLRRVPKSRLGCVVATRLIRTAVRPLSAPLLPSRAQVLAAFCADDAADFALKLCASRASRLWADASRRESVAMAALRVSGLQERVMRRAARAARLEFDVFGREVAFDAREGGVDWALDPLSGRRAGDEGAGFDPKGAWALGRLDHLVALAQGVWLSPLDEVRDHLSEVLVAQVVDFTRQNPPGQGVQWLSPMEVALRSMNLALAFLMTRHRPEWQRSPSACLSLVAALWAGGRFVEANLESDTAVPNNHLVACLTGLFHLGVLFAELPDAARWRARAAAGLCREIEAQTLSDGFGFEGSTGYHRLSTELFTLALFAADAGRVDLGRAFQERLHARFWATAKLIDASGHVPQIGDNDSGRALPLTHRHSLDHGYLLPLGAALFGDAALRRTGFDDLDEALFLMGPAGLRRFEALAETVTHQSEVLPSAGIAILRAGHVTCTLCAGSNGQNGVGGHGHNDKLAIDIRCHGARLIADPGSPGYTADPDERALYRSTAAHATLDIDGEEQNPIPTHRPFALPDISRARITRVELGPIRDVVEAEHLGYRRLKGAPIHRRGIVLDRQRRVLAIVDRVLGDGRHRLVLRFPSAAPVRQRQTVPSEVRDRLVRGGIDLERVAQSALELDLRSAAPDAVALLVLPRGGEVTTSPFAIAEGYGERLMGTMIACAFERTLPCELWTVFLL